MSDKSRRKLLKAIAAGSGAIVAGRSLPESWTRPVVDSVLLPAHALTSNAVIYSAIVRGVFLGAAPQEKESLFAKAVDTLIPEASAGDGGVDFGFFVCAIVSGTSVSVSVAGLISNSTARMIRRGTLDLGGAVGSIIATGNDVSQACGFSPNQLERPARIGPVSDTEIVVLVSPRERAPVLQLTVPRNDAGCVPEPSVQQCI